MIGTLAALWGISGIFLLLGSAVYRLAPLAIHAFSMTFQWHHWASLILIVVFMSYAEGYRGFQQRFSPRVAARARYLRTNPTPLRFFLAPLFCMGFFHASLRRKITSYSVTGGIVVLIVLVRLLPQPWRGIIDTGVVIGLIWGMISLLFSAAEAFSSEDFPYSPEIPDSPE